jgi:CoA-transferase family III
MAAPTAPTSPPGPLDGLVVLGIEQAVAAPFATRQLADLGARVIKIERPDEGDFARGYDRTVNGQASHFGWLNRGKESLLPPVTNDWNESIGAVPALGRHTDDVLAWLDLDSTTTPSKKASAR